MDDAATCIEYRHFNEYNEILEVFLFHLYLLHYIALTKAIPVAKCNSLAPWHHHRMHPQDGGGDHAKSVPAVNINPIYDIIMNVP